METTASRTIGPAASDVVNELARATAGWDGQGVLSVYLFGSHARGRPHRESDIDVGILVSHDRYPTRRDRFEARLRLISTLAIALRCQDVDVVILNDAPPHLGRAIVTGGKRVYCASETLDHAYVRDVQLRAADLEPWLRRMRSGKLTALGSQ